MNVIQAIEIMENAINELKQLREQNAYLQKRLAIAEKYMPSEWMDEADLI